MRVGIPTETKNNEFRVAITPAGVAELTRRGHEVLIQAGAGEGSAITDADFKAAGAQLVGTADQVWADADLLLKVKEPIAAEYGRLRHGQILFTFLHLAASRACTDALLDSGTTSIAYETVQTADGALPLLAPMSEVAGRLAAQVGAYHLMRTQGGRGVLMGGVPGVEPADVVVIGAGTAGYNAARIANGMGATVTVLDINIDKLRQLDAEFCGRIHTRYSSAYELEGAVKRADLVIGAVLVPGAKAPKLVSNSLVAHMKPGAVLVDIAIDQGGCFEGSRPTTYDHPTFAVHDTLFYCVANMPASVPKTSTYALTNATMPYVLELADHGWRAACRSNPALGQRSFDARRGVTVRTGGHRPGGAVHRARQRAGLTLGRSLRRAHVGSKGSDDVGRGSRPGLPVRRSRPKVCSVRVVRLHRRRPYRLRHLVDLRITQRRHVVEQASEVVGQTARIPTRERPSDQGGIELWILQRGTVCGIGTGFVGQQQCGTNLRGDRSAAQHGGHVLSRAQATGCNQRHIMGAANPIEELVQRLRTGFHVRRERSAVPAGSRALDHQAVRARGNGHTGLVDRRHGDRDQQSQRAQPLHDIRRRRAEGERHHLRTNIGYHLEFAHPVVVVTIDGLAHLGVVVLGDLFELVRVILQLRPVGDAGLGHKQIGSDRTGSGGARSGDIVGEPVRAQIAAGDETKPASVGHRRGQRRGARAAGHRGADDRHRDVPEAQHHRANSPTASAGTARVRKRTFELPYHRSKLLRQ